MEAERSEEEKDVGPKLWYVEHRTCLFLFARLGILPALAFSHNGQVGKVLGW